MSEYTKHHRRTQLFMLLVIPSMLFPVFWILAFLYDCLLGDAAVVLRIQYDSKWDLLRQFLGDWYASLPLSVVIVWLILLSVFILSACQVYRGARYSLLVSGFVGLMAGFWLFKSEISGVLVMGIAGCCIGCGMLIMQWLSDRLFSRS